MAIKNINGELYTTMRGTKINNNTISSTFYTFDFKLTNRPLIK